jgi:ABC-type ATPase with predicted acetyltransferase domain
MLFSTFLPGRLTIEPGQPRHYRLLERFHYVARRPATWAAVQVAKYADPAWQPADPGDRERIVAVGVLSYPVPTVKTRDRHFNMIGASYGQRLRFANQHIRTISRIIIHPQFRAIGLATQLVRQLCSQCPTRYVEAMAVMGSVHPLFERAGMTRITPANAPPGKPIYYLFDRFAAGRRPALPL